MFKQLPMRSGPKQVTFSYNEKQSKITRNKLNQQYLSGLNWESLITLCTTTSTTMGSFITSHQSNISYGKLVEYLNPAIFATMANKEDNPTFAEAMASPDSGGFINRI